MINRSWHGKLVNGPLDCLMMVEDMFNGMERWQ